MTTGGHLLRAPTAWVGRGCARSRRSSCRTRCSVGARSSFANGLTQDGNDSSPCSGGNLPIGRAEYFPNADLATDRGLTVARHWATYRRDMGEARNSSCTIRQSMNFWQRGGALTLVAMSWCLAATSPRAVPQTQAVVDGYRVVKAYPHDRGA